MSFRLLTHRIVKHGRYFLQSYCKRDIYINIFEHGKQRTINVSKKSLPKDFQALRSQTGLQTGNGFFRFGQHARRLFVDNVLNRVTSSGFSSDLRNGAIKKLFYGDSAPFFALIGVSLASGAGILTKEDELEGVCWEIRKAASRLQNSWNKEEISKKIDDRFNLEKLDIGLPIAKGSTAVVYAAALKDHSDPLEVPRAESSPAIDNFTDRTLEPSEFLSPIQNMSRFVYNFGGSVDNLHTVNQEASFNRWQSNEKNFNECDLISPTIGFNPRRVTSPDSIRQNLEYDNQNEGDLYTPSPSKRTDSSNDDLRRYPLALKMMFNYDIQSNAMSILRAMYKETIPARRRMKNEEADAWEQLLRNQTLSLPPHPNIVLMFGVFCAEVPNLRGNLNLYPMALPPRINPLGYGRNMSLFLLMKRYDYCLRDYLEQNNISMRARVLLFAQLLEAVAHLSTHGVAHRDLKSDNILIDITEENTAPVLVLSDFGCALADKAHGLQLPYTSQDTDKGGNTALMAPEIINKVPGSFSMLDYSKSDLWACGAIAYEIFGHQNPFYPTHMRLNSRSLDTKSLKNVNYKETDLPELNAECPAIVRQLIVNILNPSPGKRLSPHVAANVMQLYLWAPSSWQREGGMPRSPEILQWLLSLTTKVMCDGSLETVDTKFSTFKSAGRRTYTEYLLICSFLARARLRKIRDALSWIQTIV